MVAAAIIVLGARFPTAAVPEPVPGGAEGCGGDDARGDD